MSELTQQEKSWITRFKKCCRAKPKNLRLYVIDGDEIIICKDKVSSDDFMEAAVIEVDSGSVITDMHDELNNGDV